MQSNSSDQNLWQFQEAKSKFSHVVNNALASGPQTITRHGERAVVVLAYDEYEQLRNSQKPKTTFKEWLSSTPPALGELLDTDLPRDYLREIDL